MKIFVLESLRDKDPKTGEYIYNHLKSKSATAEFHPFKSKEGLFNILKLIEVDTAANKEQPFVHFDCHGNDNGIGVVKQDGSEELVTWKEIRDKFRSIYMASNKKSIICMSSCKGFNAIKMVAQCEPCPYDHVCGSFEKISFKESYLGYKMFYNLILSGETVFDASCKVHNDADMKSMKFIGLNSQTLFKIAIDGYIEKECTEDILKNKKEQTIALMTAFAPLNPIQKDYIDKAFTLEGQKLIIENCAQTFFSLK